MTNSRMTVSFLALILCCHGCVPRPKIDPNTAPPAGVPALTEVLTAAQNPQTIAHSVPPFPNQPPAAMPLGLPIGPYIVTNAPINTGIFLAAGFPVNVSSSGKIDFGGAVIGGGAPILDADGDLWPTPANYPAPSLLKNSLICGIGSTVKQCGRRARFQPAVAGNLILSPNDGSPSDNSRGWIVMVHVDDPLPFAEVLPASGVILRFDTPYPSDVAIAVNGTQLPTVDAGAGVVKAQVSNRDWDTTGVGHWQAVIDLPPAQRNGPGCVVDITNISINPRHTGAQARSVPLQARLLRRRNRGTQFVTLNKISGTTSNFVFNGNVSDPAVSMGTPHAAITRVQLQGGAIDYKDRFGEVSQGVVHNQPIPNGMFGREVEGEWTLRTNSPPPPLAPTGIGFSIDWASVPVP